MKTFLRHLRVLILIPLGAVALAGCMSSVTGPAQRRTDLAVAGGIGTAAVAGLATAAITRNPWVVLGAAGGGLLVGGLGVPYVVETFFQQRGMAEGDTLTHNGTVYRVINGRAVAVATAQQPTASAAGYGGYSVPVADYQQQGYQTPAGLPVDNPVRVRACQPTAQAPARAVTSSGTPWVSCGRPGAGPALSFRAAPTR